MKETVKTVASKLNALSRTVDAHFEQFNQRFEHMDQRFEQVDMRFEHLLREIAAEGARTRRHFDIVAEQMRSERKLAFDQSSSAVAAVVRLTAANAADHLAFEKRLADHDKRLADLERR
jgi:conjugal transfer/entry exclusion protein